MEYESENEISICTGLMLNDIEKKSAKSCKTGVILVIWYFTVLPCSSSASSG